MSGYVPRAVSHLLGDAATFATRPSGGLTYSGHPLACAAAVATINEEPAVAPYDPSPFARERHVWLGLHAAATRSLAQGSMIVFS
ncbi:hypothetical protein SALBM217S_03817 [Streptomyces griseoloalbus]